MDLPKSDLEWEEELGPYGKLRCESSHTRLADHGPPETLEQAGEKMGGISSGPATLWGILVSEKSTDVTIDEFGTFSESEEHETNAALNLWIAAGYGCQLPMEDSAASPAVTDAMPINDEESIQSHRSSDLTGPYIVKEAPGKGQGVFTTRDVVKGERVLTDKPFFVVTKPYSDRKVLAEFERMPLARRQQYMRLYCPDLRDDTHMIDVMRIFEANCFNIGHSAAMFLTATRFNHSCVPNTYYSWSERRREITLRSMVNVAEGEEMTINYGYPFFTCLQRRSELRIYNFCCKCPACQTETTFGQASESRRLAMKALNDQIIMFQLSLNDALLIYGLRDPLAAILRLIEIIKEEGLQGELMTPYRDAADYLKGRGRFEEALKFAHMELEEEVVCLGEDSEVVEKTIGYIEELKMELENSKEEEVQRFEDEAEEKEEDHGWQVEMAPREQTTDSEAGIQEPE
ncbi:MAG: hypothetical protein Q9161_007843 [Pseudevernia consocians]